MLRFGIGRFAYLVLAVWSINGLTACNRGAQGTGSSGDRIKIGVIAPLTGETAWGGQPSKWAAQMAADEINAAGGVNGKKIEMIFADGRCTPQASASAAEQLITQDKVQFLMGEWCSSATIAAVEAAKKYEIPFLVQISTADNIGKNGGKYTFQSAMQNVDTVKWMASMMLKNLHFNSIAIMAENNDFGNSFLSNMDQAMTGVGKKVVLKLTPDRASTNYLGELTRLKDANPDVIAFTMTQTAAANFIRTAKEKGITAQLIGHYPPPPVLFERAVGNAAIGLTRVTFFAESEKNTPKQKEWVRKFKAYYKEKANQDVPVLHWYVVSYDGIYLITDAIKRGGTDKAQWAAAMEKSDFDGVLGRYQFDANRQAKPAGLPMVAIKDVPGEGDIPKLEVLDWK